MIVVVVVVGAFVVYCTSCSRGSRISSDNNCSSGGIIWGISCSYSIHGGSRGNSSSNITMVKAAVVVVVVGISSYK